jgi:hypothetical protein
MAVGMDPRSPANRGWRWGWTPDPRQIGDGTAIPDPRQIGDGGGDGDRGFRALHNNPAYELEPKGSHWQHLNLDPAIRSGDGRTHRRTNFDAGLAGRPQPRTQLRVRLGVPPRLTVTVTWQFKLLSVDSSCRAAALAGT